jgi:hypothetical protein
MAKILKFPSTNKIQPLRVRSARWHRITIEILDERDPRRTRWRVQFEIQEVVDDLGPGLSGFTDRAVATGRRHRFNVSSTQAARSFATMMAPLIAAGKVAIWIDGTLVRSRPAMAA